MIRFEHEYEDKVEYFKHRITSTKPKMTGEYANYQTPAILKTSDGTIVGVTDYYKDSIEFPNPDKLYLIIEL